MGKQRDYTEMPPLPLGKWVTRLLKVRVIPAKARMQKFGRGLLDSGFRGMTLERSCKRVS